MTVKASILIGKQVVSAVKEMAGEAKLVSPSRMAVMSDNEKIIAVTVDKGSPEDDKLKWLHGKVLKGPDGKIEFNPDRAPKLAQNLLLAELSLEHGNKASVTRYYEPHMDFVQSLGVLLSLPYEKSHELVLGMLKSKAGDDPPIGGATKKDGSSRGGHW